VDRTDTFQSAEEPHDTSLNPISFSNHARPQTWSSTMAAENMNAPHDALSGPPQSSQYDMFSNHPQLLPTWSTNPILCHTETTSPTYTNKYGMISESDGFSFPNGQNPFLQNHFPLQSSSFHSIEGYQEEDMSHAQAELGMQEQSTINGYSSSPLESGNIHLAPLEPAQER
jgi:hypothetical protein